jgi:general secretion pathway protein D
VVGNLFRFRDTRKRKRNLMIFLHPLILRDAAQGTLYTNDKYSYIREQQLTARQRGVALMPEVETPLLVPQEQVKKQNSMLDIAPEAQPETQPEPEFAPGINVRSTGFNNK